MASLTFRGPNGCAHRAVTAASAATKQSTIATTRARPRTHPLAQGRTQSRPAQHATLTTTTSGLGTPADRALSRRDKRRQREEYRSPRFKLAPSTERTSVSAQTLLLELKWVRDRVALARRIEQLLAQGDYDKARELTKAAQKNSIDCVVAWNLIFEYLMGRNQPMVAFKLYNDMKKAGTRPNSRTYTVMFSGLAGSRSPNAVKTAWSIYRSLRSEKSDIKPSTIHYNAFLEVCARHGDREDLWKIVEELPESGQGSPDARTYTIILNSLRSHAAKKTAAMNVWSQKDGILAVRAEALNDAKGIWAVVLAQWRKGQITMDSHLLSSMGKLLQQTEVDGNCWDVFQMYGQVMGLPLPDSSVNKSLASITDQFQGEDRAREDDPFDGLFDGDSEAPESARQRQRRPQRQLQRPLPSNKDLTLLLETSQTMSNSFRISIGRYYWDLLTNPKGAYKLSPDTHAFHEYLRLLRVARNSREAYRAVVEASARAPEVLSHKTFIIAMSTCERDRNNPNVFQIASKLVDLMAKHLRAPEPRVLLRYAELTEHVTTDAQLKSRLEFQHGKEAVGGVDGGGGGGGGVARQLTAGKGSAKDSSKKHCMDQQAQENPAATLFGTTHLDALQRLQPHVARIQHLLACGKMLRKPITRELLALAEQEKDHHDRDPDAPQNAHRERLPRGPALDVDQAVQALVAIRRLHLTVLNPRLCELSRDEAKRHKREADQLRLLIEPRRLIRAATHRVVTVSEEEGGAGSEQQQQQRDARDDAGHDVTAGDRAAVARARAAAMAI
ncbi:hypothetical protein KEM52_005281 [Ascosphaera acerosa]|nr:hypothetical protein KEM52_005281 [Ascosphaera acerosa]